ncbi:hypothetical protein GLOIN_2v873442 [Rhizophagus clarus]|uniref:Uncharacterized protein n=1 Tax=Rhizophagus clarus TaxID=94130 RepID=A0A8H3KX86_9GLOM|nr:hypothetical protein GLOIN_2v873442 [Rhizophagus clarus]
MVTHWVKMIENELQEDQDNKVANIVDTYDISIENIKQLQHSAVNLQTKWELKKYFCRKFRITKLFRRFYYWW